MRQLLLFGAVAVIFAAPAFADTLKEVTTKGVVMTVQGADIPITYKPDGTFTVDFQGQSVEGKWRIDGAKLCTTSSFSPEERCTEYPANKKSGDEFEIQGARGTVKIKIK